MQNKNQLRQPIGRTAANVSYVKKRAVTATLLQLFQVSKTLVRNCSGWKENKCWRDIRSRLRGWPHSDLWQVPGTGRLTRRRKPATKNQSIRTQNAPIFLVSYCICLVDVSVGDLGLDDEGSGGVDPWQIPHPNAGTRKSNLKQFSNIYFSVRLIQITVTTTFLYWKSTSL